MKTLLAICLSLFLFGCDNSLPPKPEGLHCTYFQSGEASTTGFYCNGINDPEKRVFFSLDNSEIQKAQCMPLDTFERYTNYVEEIKKLAKKRCQ